MSGDMRVKLTLDLVNRLSPGAKAAARDIKTVQQAAGELKKEKGGDAIAEGLKKITPAGRQAAREIRGVKTEARALAGEGGPTKLTTGIQRAADATRRLRSEMEATKRAQRDFVKHSPLGTAALGNSHQRPTAPGAAGSGGAGMAAGAAAAAAGRNALLPLAAAYGGYRGVGAGIRGTVGQSISFEKAMAEVRKKVDGMDDPVQFAAMEKAISKWAIAYGRTREEVAALVAEAGAGGVSQADMPEFARINLAASTAWDVSASQAGNALAKIRAATQWSNKELEIFVDKVNALADAGSAKEMDVVEMFQRAGAAAKAAGVEFDTSLAFLTAMNNVAIAPEVASRGFNAFASTLRTASDKPKRVAEGLKMIGLTTKAVEKGMKTNATATMISVLEKLEAHADKAAVAIKVFGQEWWDEVARAGQALPEIRKALDIVGNPAKYAGSAQNNLNIQLATTDNHLTRLKALTSEVGDRLGRWALPGINEGIERIIAGMNELEKRAEAKKEVESLAQKQARGEALTPEQREKLASDAQMAFAVKRRGNQISAQKDYADTVARSEGAAPADVLDERRQLLRRQLQRQIDTLQAEQRASPVGFGRGKQTRLSALQRQLADIPSNANERRLSGADPRRPADQSERGGPDRAEVMALRERVRQLDNRILALDELVNSSANPADRAGFTSDRLPYLARRAQAEAIIRRKMAPNVAAAGNFGFGAGGAPGTAQPQSPGAGRLGFGLNGGAKLGKGGWGDPGAAWAQKVRDDFDIDLGSAGMTMMERLTSGMRSGAAGAEATAAGVKTGIETALQGGDLTAAGHHVMSTYAAGIRAGGAEAVAAAQGVASQVKGALGSGGGRRGLSGALHDGVD